MSGNLPTVLLVAGDAAVLRDLLGQFPRAHWKPMAARAGAQVQKVLAARPPMLAIVHNSLEDMEGAALCAWIRQHSPKTASILLTQEIPRATPNAPYNTAIRHPTPPGVLHDVARKMIAQRSSSDAAWDRFMAEIAARHQAMDEQSYYQLFGVPEDAYAEQIRTVYDAFSLRYHPDRYMHLKQRPDYVKLQDLYKRIGEAYRVLTHPDKRAHYNKLLAKGELRYNEATRKTGPQSIEDLSENPRVKRFLKLAQISLADGNPRAALQNLKFALSMESDNEDLRERITEIESQL